MSTRQIKLEKCQHVLYFTGSMTSKALLILLVTEKQPLSKVIFLDSGHEIRPVYDNVKWAKQFCDSIDVPFEIFSQKQLMKFIQADISDKTIHTYNYVGIRYDEAYRIRKSSHDKVTKIYPLVERQMNVKQCLEVIQNYEKTQRD